MIEHNINKLYLGTIYNIQNIFIKRSDDLIKEFENFDHSFIEKTHNIEYYESDKLTDKLLLDRLIEDKKLLDFTKVALEGAFNIVVNKGEIIFKKIYNFIKSNETDMMNND